MNDNREYRSFTLIERAKTEEPEYIVEGYASTFEPYAMWTEHYDDGDVTYYEQIDTHAFDDADMSDCVFRVDHTGPVYARVSADTVKLDVDEGGLHNITDLSKTARGRELYEDILAGNYPQMSFAFTVEEDHYDSKKRTRVIDRIAKVYDISPVTWPANPTTSLSARSKEFFDGVIKNEKAERLETERRAEAMKRISKALNKEVSDDEA